MLRKIIFRTIKNSLARFLAIFAIIALGVGFFAGLRVTEKTMKKTADRYLSDCRLYDYRLVSTLGFTEDDVETFRAVDKVSGAYGSVSADVIIRQEDGADVVLHAHTLQDGINGVDVLFGRLPEAADECLLDARYATEDAIGTTLHFSESNSEDTLDFFAHNAYTVVGIANSSEYINFQRGTTALAGGKVAGFVYLLPDGFATDYFTEIYITLSEWHEIYSDAYDKALDDIRPTLEHLLIERADLRFDAIYNDAKAKIDDAQATLEEKKGEFADAEKELTDGWETYWAEKADAQAQFDETKEKLDAARTELDNAWDALATAKDSPAAAMPQIAAQLAAQEAALSQSETEYNEQLEAYNTALAEADEKFKEANQKLLNAQKELDDAKPELDDAQAEIDDARDELNQLEKPSVYTLDRYTNFGFAGFQNDIAIVSGVAKVFPVFFFLVAALVCITTMTRMVSEQRTENGVLKALGYSNFAVASQYLIYAGSASILGCIFGFLLGSKLMPLVLWEIYQIMYSIHRPPVFVLDWTLFALCSSFYILGVLGVTYGVCRKDLAENSASLMRPKAPGAGKRIFLEYIRFLWKPMKFLHKVSARNIFRYKKRMLMMILGIGGCTALLLTGFGIRDSIQPIVSRQYGEISLFDAVVSFLREPDATEQAEFEADIRDFASDFILLHISNVDLSIDNKGCSVKLAACSGDMTPFINLHQGKNPLAFPSAGEAVVNYRVAEEYKIAVGDTIELRDSDYNQMTVRICGVYDNYLEDIVYVSAETFQNGFGFAPELNTAYVNFTEEADIHAAGAAILGMENVATLSLTEDRKETVGNMLQSLDYVVLIVLVCAGALAFIVLYNLTNITITERTREIATLKVLGFYRSEQNSYVFRENIILAVISAICGFPLGIALLRYTMGQIKIANFYFGCCLKPQSYLWSFLLTILFAILVDLTLTSKTKNINMAEAMKALE